MILAGELPIPFLDREYASRQIEIEERVGDFLDHLEPKALEFLLPVLDSDGRVTNQIDLHIPLGAQGECKPGKERFHTRRGKHRTPPAEKIRDLKTEENVRNNVLYASNVWNHWCR